ncbi:MAG: hypothetical protein ABW184_06075 [Sphingobium sp.]
MIAGRTSSLWMDWRNRAIEAIVGGSAGLLVIAVYILGRNILDTADDGDWLAFSGAIIGVMLTIGGAAFVQWVPGHLLSRKRVREIRRAADFLIVALEELPSVRSDVQKKLEIISNFNNDFVRFSNTHFLTVDSLRISREYGEGWTRFYTSVWTKADLLVWDNPPVEEIRLEVSIFVGVIRKTCDRLALSG